MDETEFAASLVGKRVEVVFKQCGERDLSSQVGTVVSINPRVCMNLKALDGMSRPHLVFAGYRSGIVEIKDEREKTIYRNDEVPKAYTDGTVSDMERERICGLGTFLF